MAKDSELSTSTRRESDFGTGKDEGSNLPKLRFLYSVFSGSLYIHICTVVVI